MKTFLRFWLLYGGLLGSWMGSAKAQGIIDQSDWNSKFKDGNATLSDIPLVALNFVKSSLQIIGTFAVIMIMVGGVQYILGGLTDNKEQGKKTILYALGGTILALLSWFIVDFIIQFLTDKSFFS